MTTSDPIFERLRGLPPVGPSPEHGEAVRRAALALVEAVPARPRLLPTLAVATATVGYFCWMVAFLLAAHP